MDANIPKDLSAAIEKMQSAARTLADLLSAGDASIFQSSRGAFEPFRTYRLDMLNNNNVLTPFKIGPHKSILYRGIEAVSSSGVITPQAYTANDVAYYLAGRKDSDSARWIALQVGKSIEFDFPVDQGWLYVPNASRNPTFAIFEVSVVGYVRSYSINTPGSSNQITDGSTIEPYPAVTVDTTAGGVEIVAAGSSVRTVTLYHQGGSDVWIGGALGGGFAPQVNYGVPLKAGERMVIKNTSEISGICASGSALVSYQIEA